MIFALIPLLLCMMVWSGRTVEAKTHTYDQPLAQISSAVPQDVAGDAASLECYLYPGFVVLRVDSHTPAGDTAIFVLAGAGRHLPKCALPTKSSARNIGGHGRYFAGVKDGHIVLRAADPNGPTPFEIYDAPNVALRFSGAFVGADPSVTGEEQGLLHIRYRQGRDAGCSILTNATACWDKLKNNADTPLIIRRLAPPVALCRAGYARQKAPGDDPSLISFALDVQVLSNGTKQIISAGDLLCDPMP